MIMTNKLLPVALVAVLIGGSVGAIVMNRTQSATAEPQSASSTAPATDMHDQANASGNEQLMPAEFKSASEQTAFKAGFADGLRSCEAGATGNQVSSTSYQNGQPPIVSRNTGRTYANSSSSSQTVSSVAPRPRSRSFWQKHRDKLTVAAGTGGGALIGGLIGGKKGAAIGALGGGAGSAVYTYKIRKRNRRY